MTPSQLVIRRAAQLFFLGSLAALWVYATVGMAVEERQIEGDRMATFYTQEKMQ